MKIVILNGLPLSGKDQFVTECKSILGDRCGCVSSVDYVKEVARNLGWNGEKTPHNRRFLSDLKDALTHWNEVPMQKMREAIEAFPFKDEDRALFFLIIREPDEIEKAASFFSALTAIMRRREVENTEQSNHADENIFNYAYDYTIMNNGSIEELHASAQAFIDHLFEN